MKSIRLRRRPAVTRLDDRTVPAQFGTPWADPTHLTLSFAPDGTPALSAPSGLFAALDGQMARADWQLAVERAAQAWAEAAGVNVGLVADAGGPFGVTGPPQGDPRFGDIRVGGLPMADALAEAIPPDASLAGTLAGDVYVNSAAAFTPDVLYGVALHELGHALGLASNDDPTSVMNDTYHGLAALGPDDVAAVRALYGSRAPDANEGAAGNNTIRDATRVKFDSAFDGSTPLVVFGDVTTPADADVFDLPTLDAYAGPMTVRLQTAGVSLLAPELAVYDKRDVLLGTAAAAAGGGDVVTYTLPAVAPASRYYLRVAAAPGTAFAVGRYGLAVTFDGLVQPSALSVDTVLRGPFDSVSTRNLIDLFKNPAGTAFNDDLGRNETIQTSTLLATAPGFAANTRFRTTASIATPADVDFYHVKAPATQGGARVVLTVTARAVEPNGAAQRVELYDAARTRVPATVLANGNGTFTVQAANLPANTDYYVRVGGGLAGNYQLDVAFGPRATAQTTFTTGTVPAGGAVGTTLYLAETQVFGFSLAASGPAGAGVEMTIADASGNVVFTLTGRAGDTRTGATGFLAPGEYRVVVRALDAAGPVVFAVRGSGFTDPIGPQPSDSATKPQYTDPSAPGGYLYPDGTKTPDPYLWILWLVL